MINSLVLALSGVVMTGHSFEPLKYDQTNNVVIDQRTTDEDLFNSGSSDTGSTSNEVDRVKLSKIFNKNEQITQDFGGNAKFYKQFGLKGHNGLDIGVPIGTKIYSPIDGWLETSNDHYGYGKNVVIRNKIKDNKGNITSIVEVIIGHMSKFSKYGSYSIKAGELVGLSGNTGNSTGPHTHLGIRFHDVDTLSEDNPWGDVLDSDNGFQGWLNPLVYFNSEYVDGRTISGINE